MSRFYHSLSQDLQYRSLLSTERSKKSWKTSDSAGPEFTLFCPDAAFCETTRMILCTQIKGNDLISKTTHSRIRASERR